jgi:hypothetical protein
MIHEKKHFMKTVKAGGGRGFHCTCCFPGPRRDDRKRYLRAMRRAYNRLVSKEVQRDLD